MYNPYGKPWITIEKASTSQLKEQIIKYPPGALNYTMNDSGEKLEAIETKVNVITNGPLVLIGSFEVIPF